MKTTPFAASEGSSETWPGSEPRWRRTAAVSSMGSPGAAPSARSIGSKESSSRPFRLVRRHSSSVRDGSGSRS